MTPAREGTSAGRSFDAQAFLDAPGAKKNVVHYARGESIFAQGDRCEDVRYIQTGGVKLSVTSKRGREAVVAILGAGDFFGEGALAAQPVRTGSATAITPSVIATIAVRSPRAGTLTSRPGGPEPEAVIPATI